ncbi:MAG: response regulator [Candidatus Methylomirabilia bacterium]
MGKTVLVVDDSSAMRALLGVALRSAGFAVVEARDGRAALERLAAGPVDLIVSDCIMPVMDGIGFVRAVKQRPDLHLIPIIMLTTESQEAQIQEGRALGVQAWIVKPFRTEKFVEAVHRVLGAAAS